MKICLRADFQKPESYHMLTLGADVAFCLHKNQKYRTGKQFPFLKGVMLAHANCMFTEKRL